MRHALIAVLVAVLPLSARADDPDPKALLRAAAEAVKGVTTLTYTARTEGVGAMGVKVPAATASVTISRAGEKDRLGWRFAINPSEPSTSPGALLAAAYDGDAYTTTNDADKTLTKADAKDAGTMILGDSSIWAVGWLLRWGEFVEGPYGTEDAAGRAEYNGRVMVAGEPCHVVHADYADLSDARLYGAWWYLAESDSLPRRIEFHYYDNDRGDGFARLTLSDVNVSAEAPSQEVFVLAAPEGYEVKEFKPAVAAAASRPAPREQPAVEEGKPAPAWTLKDADGKERSLADYKGKIVLLDFWATWCGPCLQAMPGVQKLHEKYADQGVVVLGVNAWESGDPRAFMKEHGYTYGLLMDGDETAAAYGVAGIPAFFLIGPDGTLIAQRGGYAPDNEAFLSRVIEEHLDSVQK